VVGCFGVGRGVGRGVVGSGAGIAGVLVAGVELLDVDGRMVGVDADG
jgi:hypothetical protein